MHTNNIFVPDQFGFRQGSSTEKSAFKLIDSVLKSINQKVNVGGIFCDLEKDFECVDHEILLANLHYYGIKGTVANWFRSYLTNRKQEKTEITSFDKFSSKWRTVKHGVPQWSILGPLHFIIYINVLSPTINTLTEPILFANDISVIISSKNFDDFSAMTNTVLFRMSKWFTSDKLVLNLDKTNTIKFTTNKPPQYGLNTGCDEKYIEESINAKLLRLQIDNHLNWKNHTDCSFKRSMLCN
jgi:hypothetical protein